MGLSDTWKDKQDGVDDILAEDFNDVAHNVIDLQDNPARADTADVSFTGITTSNDLGATITDKILSTAVDGTTFTIAYNGEVEFDFLINTSGVSVLVDDVLLKTTTTREDVTYIGNVQSSIKLSSDTPFSCISKVFNGVTYKGGIIGAKDYESLIKIPMLEKQIVQLQKPAGTAFKSYSLEEKVTFSQGVNISENRIEADPTILSGGQASIALSGYWRFKARVQNVTIYIDGNALSSNGRLVEYEGYINEQIVISVPDGGVSTFTSGLEERIFEGGIITAEDYEKFVLLQEASEKAEKAIEEKPNKNEVSNALKGYKSGEILILDVSPFEHEISAKISSKNVFDISKIISSTNVTVNADNSITVNTTATSAAVTTSTPNTLKTFAPMLEVGKVYTLSANTTGTQKRWLLINSTTGNVFWNFGESVIMTQALLDSGVYWYASGVNTTATISDIQIELGTSPTSYSPVVDISSAKLLKELPDGTTETFAPDAQGNVTGILSVYPETKLYSDMAGILVEAEYNRDINKAFADFQNAMISLGGNV